MISGLLGKKVGMTQIFNEDGHRVPVTVLEVGPCTVQVVKSVETDGYRAVQIGFGDAKEKRVKKPQREYLKKKNLKMKKFVREFDCTEDSDVKVGDEITNSIIQKGDYLDITGTSKGKGFQGGMKRCGWAGGLETHGGMSHRRPGSIGASSYPSRVVKGHGMPGQMGNEKVTVQNVEVIEVDKENNTVTVKGAVPGANGTYLMVRYAKKITLAEREVIEEEVVEEVKEEAQAAPQEEAKKEAPEAAAEAPKEEPQKEATEEEKTTEEGSEK